jgi:hypothetical protein
MWPVKLCAAKRMNVKNRNPKRAMKAMLLRKAATL